MLTLIEKLIFLALLCASLVAATFAILRLFRMVGAGKGSPDKRLAIRRLGLVLARILTFQPVFRSRFWPGVFHSLVGWGFGFYLLVNVFDILRQFSPSFEITGWAGDGYRLLADLLSTGILLGMGFFILRRFLFKPADLTTRTSTFLHPKARHGIRRDSIIVSGFIVLHVGSRFLGESLAIATHGRDGFQPLASLVASLWSQATPATLQIGQHLAFWLALGSILLFIPYFPYSKHVHLFFAPLNFLLKPERRSIGEMTFIDLDDQSIDSFGVGTLADLSYHHILDAHACIMCYRCQAACPAYQTGKLLSPAALEINTRYFLNGLPMKPGDSLPADRLVEFAIPAEAVWACTACGACTDICPVGNDPMQEILEIRRSLTLMENSFPHELEGVFRGLERTANPWNIPPSERMKWAQGLNVPTVQQDPQPEILWWVGCAPSLDARSQKTARAFTQILNAAGVRFAVLGEDEQCTGDSARRAGREDIFFGLAHANVEKLNSINPPRIVTTCPHCLHVLKNEYPAFGGNYQVIHHSQFIRELVQAGRLHLTAQQTSSITFHDPCYLGRQNGITTDPRQVLSNLGYSLVEMENHATGSFCCGAGGAQAWKEEAPGTIRISEQRLAEAKATGVAKLATGCPFCLNMLTSAASASGETLEIVEFAELVASQITPTHPEEK